MVIVVENVHWIDASSEELLKSLAERAHKHAVLLVLTTRPGASLDWLPSATERLQLEGLTHDDIGEMVGALCASRSVSEPLFQLLVAKGGGNPLYVEEIVRQLQETEGIVVENGEARLRAADVTVPETIRDIIAARVDRLAESPKQTLQVASVVGRRFGVSLVSHVRETERDQVAGDLKDLHAVDFVFPSAHDPELMYSFKHALTQDVVYTSLLERRRRRFHAAAGRGLEELYAGRIDDVVEILAYHFERERGGREGGRLRHPRRREGAAPVGQHRGPGPVRGSPQAPGLDARHRAQPAPQDRRRRQAGRGQVRPRPPRRARSGPGGDPRRGGGGQPTRPAAPRGTTGPDSCTASPAAGRRCPSRIAAKRRRSPMLDGLDELKALAECCLTHVYGMAGDLVPALEAGERALADVRGARERLVGLPDAVGPQHRRDLLGRVGAEPGVLPAGPRARPGGERPSAQGCRLVADRLDAHPAGRRRRQGSAAARRRWPCLRARSTPPWRGRPTATAWSRPGRPTRESRSWPRPSRGSSSHTSHCTRSLVRRLAWRCLPRQGERAQARTLCEELLAMSREAGYRTPRGHGSTAFWGSRSPPEDPAAAARTWTRPCRFSRRWAPGASSPRRSWPRPSLRRAAGDRARGAPALRSGPSPSSRAWARSMRPVRVRAAQAALGGRREPTWPGVDDVAERGSRTSAVRAAGVGLPSSAGDVLGRADRQRGDREGGRRGAGGDEAAAAHQVQVRDVVGSRGSGRPRSCADRCPSGGCRSGGRQASARWRGCRLSPIAVEDPGRRRPWPRRAPSARTGPRCSWMCGAGLPK